VERRILYSKVPGQNHDWEKVKSIEYVATTNLQICVLQF